MATSNINPDSLQVGPDHVATKIAAIYKVSASLTPAEVATIVTAEQTFNPAGFASIRSTDYVILLEAPDRGNSVLIGSCRVSANGTIAINYVNPTAGNLTPAAGTYEFLVIRPH